MRQLGLFVNLGRLELNYTELKLSGIIPLAVRYLVKSKATLQSKPECQYVHFRHADFGIFNSLI